MNEGVTEITVGLDIGTGSVGWAVINSQTHEILDANSYLFKDTVGANVDRRTHRQLRRQIDRRQRRIASVNVSLKASGFPGKPEGVSQHFQIGGQYRYRCEDPDCQLLPLTGQCAHRDPYALRAAGLVRKLTPWEFSVVALHLAKNRGWAKAGGDSNVDDSRVFCRFCWLSVDGKEAVAVGEIWYHKKCLAKLQKGASPKLPEPGSRQVACTSEAMGDLTPGAFIHKLRMGEIKPDGFPERVTSLSNLWFRREQIRYEFHRIWLQQAALDKSGLYSVDARNRIDNAIFWQRPLRDAKGGMCDIYEMEETAPLSLLDSQKFLLLCQIDNVRVVTHTPNPDPGEPPIEHSRRLRPAEIERALRHLDGVGTSVFSTLFAKAVIEPGAKGNYPSNYKFDGNRTQSKIRQSLKEDANLLGEWMRLPYAVQSTLVEAMLEADREAPRRKRLRKKATELYKNGANVSLELVKALALVDLPVGRGRLSLGALEEVLPEMENGRSYNSVRASLRQFTSDSRLNDAREAFMNNIRNPHVRKMVAVARRILYEIRDTYSTDQGFRISAVHIESTENMPLSQDSKKEVNKKNESNQKKRDIARQALREQSGCEPTAKDILAYMLWEEQGGLDIYTGATISISDLIAGRCDIDHIQPFSRSLDDSYMNKALVFKSTNHDKGALNPHEKWGRDLVIWGGIETRAGRCYATKQLASKRKRILSPELIGDATQRLHFTGQAGRFLERYLTRIDPSFGEVSMFRGGVTAEARRRWGVDSLLHDSDCALRFKKNRGDVRHHALDAIVLALIDDELVARYLANYRHQMEIQDQAGEDGKRRSSKLFPMPDWVGPALERIKEMLGDEDADHGRGPDLDDEGYLVNPRKMYTVHEVDTWPRGQLHLETFGKVLNIDGRKMVGFKPSKDGAINQPLVAKPPGQRALKEAYLLHLTSCPLHVGNRDHSVLAICNCVETRHVSRALSNYCLELQCDENGRYIDARAVTLMEEMGRNAKRDVDRGACDTGKYDCVRLYPGSIVTYGNRLYRVRGFSIAGEKRELVLIPINSNQSGWCSSNKLLAHERQSGNGSVRYIDEGRPVRLQKRQFWVDIKVMARGRSMLRNEFVNTSSECNDNNALIAA